MDVVGRGNFEKIGQLLAIFLRANSGCKARRYLCFLPSADFIGLDTCLATMEILPHD